jgi:hypothetical protein
LRVKKCRFGEIRLVLGSKCQFSMEVAVQMLAFLVLFPDPRHRRRADDPAPDALNLLSAALDGGGRLLLALGVIAAVVTGLHIAATTDNGAPGRIADAMTIDQQGARP